MMIGRILAGLAIGLLISAIYASRGATPLPADARADRIVVEKDKRLLTLYANNSALRSYRVALGREPRGTKEQEGDKRTPEGLYIIDSRNDKSAFHLALHISYPADEDRARANARGVLPGGDILVHGVGKGFGWLGRLHRALDWTSGCIAVSNEQIEEIWRAVPNGTPIEIRP